MVIDTWLRDMTSFVVPSHILLIKIYLHHAIEFCQILEFRVFTIPFLSGRVFPTGKTGFLIELFSLCGRLQDHMVKIYLRGCVVVKG